MGKPKFFEKKLPVEVVVENISTNPKCPHGPTLLFIRGKEKFFACSAYRDKKYCKFYITEGDWIKNKNKIRTVSKRDYRIEENVKKMFEVCTAIEEERSYCHDCSELFKSSVEQKFHSGHDVSAGLSLDLLSQPSKLLKPLNNDKKEAQYFFSEKSVSAIFNILTKNKLRNVLCLGAPRLHEFVKKKTDGDVTSLLLDIDNRFYSFCKDDEFCHYNLFNNHFFNEVNEIEIFDKFLKNSRKKGLCITIDPPFGGRIEPLAETLKELTKKYKSINKKFTEDLLPTILIMPYFMEPQLKNHIPSLQMADYQITYDNHSNFKCNSKNGSPIRIFTNIPLQNIILPQSESYRFCDTCQKYVGKWNIHCFKCNGCVSKNGMTYVHCDDCNKCVKPTWTHCLRCNRCCLQEHACENIPFQQKCFLCQKKGHKKSDCPQANASNDTKPKQSSKNESPCLKISNLSKPKFKKNKKMKNLSDVE